MGHRNRLGDDVQPVSSDYRADGHGCISRGEEIESFWPGDPAGRHTDIQHPIAGNDSYHRGTALSASRCAGTGSRPLWSHAVRRLIMNLRMIKKLKGVFDE